MTPMVYLCLEHKYHTQRIKRKGKSEEERMVHTVVRVEKPKRCLGWCDGQCKRWRWFLSRAGDILKDS